MVHGTVRSFFRLLGALGTTVLVLAAWFGYRLSEGPVSLSFLSPYIENALEDPKGAYSVTLDQTVLVWNRDTRALEIRAENVRAVAGTQEVIASVPEMLVTLSGPALMRGKITPRLLAFRHPTLRLKRDAGGNIQFGMGDEVKEAGSGGLSDALEEFLIPPEPDSPAAQLRRIDIIGADFDIEDARTGTSWHAPRADLRFSRDRGGVIGNGRFDLVLDGEPAHLDLDGRYVAADRDIQGSLSFSGLRPAALAGLVSAWPQLAALHLPTGGSVSGRYNLDRGLSDLRFDLVAGQGVLDLSPWLGVSWPVQSVALHGSLAAELGTANLDELRVDLGQGVLSATGSVGDLTGATALNADLHIDQIPVELVKKLWPPALAVNPRTWIEANLSDGRIHDISAKLTAHRTQNAAAAGDFQLDHIGGEMFMDGVTVQYLAPMPPVHNAKGKATFDADAFDIALAEGELFGLRLQEGRVLLGGLSAADQTAVIGIRLAGPASDVFRVIDSKPLGWAQTFGVQPAKVGGDAVVALNLAFPLLNNLRLEQMKVHAQAQTSQFSLPDAAIGLDVTDGALALDIDAKGMDVTGRLALGGIPADLRWHENFVKGAGVKSRYEISGILDDAQRRIVGLEGAPFQPPFLTGPVPVDLVASLLESGKGDVDIKAGLTRAAMKLDSLNWSKQPGVVGEASALLRLSGGRLTELPRFSVTTANGLSVQGQGSFENGALRRVVFQRAKWARSDLSGAMQIKPDGSLALDIEGASFDAREVAGGEASDPSTDRAPVKAPARPEPPQTPPVRPDDLVPLDIRARLDRIWLSDDGAVRDVSGNLVRGRRDWRQVRLDGRLPGGAPLHVELTPSAGNHRDLHVGSTDAGALFKTMGIFDNLVGGRLQLDARYDDADSRQPLSGQINVADYQLVKAPALARLLTVAALTGILEVLQGEGIHFSTLEAPFTLVDGVLELKDARAAGTSLGLTAKGQLDLDRDLYALEGTVVPMYALNSALGNLPLLGSLFSAEKGGGVFAMNYSMSGPMEDPRILVNPLSALTPGMFRRIFDIFDKGDETDVRAKPAPGQEKSPAEPAPESAPGD